MLQAARSICALALGLLTVGCQSYEVAPITSSDFQPEEDERRLWEWADAYHQHLASHGLLIDDPPAQAVVDEVAERVCQSFDGKGIEVRAHIVRDPFLNAAAVADGNLYLHSGILSRLTNKHQLATLLGHEIAHYVHRHSFREYRIEENRSDMYQAAMIVLALAAAGFAGTPSAAHLILDLAGSIEESVVGVQVSGYSRELEREADRIAFDAMRDSGYDALESVELFEALQEEESTRIKEPYFFGSHPALSERISTMRELLDTAGFENVEREREPAFDQQFNEAIANVRLINVGLNLQLGRVDTARRDIERYLRAAPDCPRGLFALGEYHRRYDRDSSAKQRALAAYRAALRSDSEYGPAFREVGLIQVYDDDCSSAVANLTRYVELEPTAQDRPIIEAYIDDCGGKQ